MKFRLIVFCTILGLYSCTDRLTYHKLKKAGLEQNNPSKILFKTIKDSLPKSEHVIYILSPRDLGSQTTLAFHALVYDVGTKKTLFIENDSARTYHIRITSKSHHFTTMTFVLNNYINGKIEYLKTLQHTGFSEGGVNLFWIFDIDLTTKKTQKFYIESILLDKQGNPTTTKIYFSGGQ